MIENIKRILIYSLFALGIFGIIVTVLIITNTFSEIYHILGIIGYGIMICIFIISVIYFGYPLLFKANITKVNPHQHIYSENNHHGMKFWGYCLRLFYYYIPMQSDIKQTNSIKQRHNNTASSPQLLDHANTVSQKDNLNNHDESKP
jgi:hypothetical protein